MALKTGDVRDAIRLNTNWLIAYVLGLDALSSAEKKELEAAGRLPKHSIDLVEKSFTLGRLKSILTSEEFGKVDYAELVKRISHMETTPLEKKTIEQVKSKAATNFKSFANRLENFIFKGVQDADNKTLADAAIRNALDSEELSALEEKAYNELVSSLEQALKDLYEQGWHLAVETEFHAAKTQGVAQAILNGLDIYAGSGGPSARVSVVPKPTACLDCKGQYLDASGNPKIFILSELIANGTNVDSKHSKTKGVHTFWKATLPPLHPRCRCDLQYIPPGASWVGGRLVMAITKAIGDSPLSATMKPQGAPANQKDHTTANPPSSPGLPSPSQAGGMGTAKTQVSSIGAAKTQVAPATGSGGKKQDMVPCPRGGGQACQEAGGPLGGAETHEAGGAVMQAHAEYQAKHQQGSSDMAESMSNTAKQHSESQSVASPHAKDLKSLATGQILDAKPLAQDEKGITESYKAHIEGLGDALVKPPAFSDNSKQSEMVRDGVAMATGAHSTPLGTAHKREKAFYQGAMMFGLTNHVPPTEVRSFQGKAASAQKWMDGFSPLGNTVSKSHANYVTGILDLCPADKVEQVRTKLSEICVTSALFNHNDQHCNNLLVSKDFDDIQMIDNSASFATGMEGYTSQLFMHMQRGGYKVTIPDHLMHKFKNTTLSDIQRGLGDTVEDWAVGQTFLRMKYMTYLQETEGGLDFDKFKNANYGTTNGLAVEPHPGYWSDIEYERTPNGGFVYDKKGGMVPKKGKYGVKISTEYSYRQANGLLANQMFESFAAQWIMDSMKHPEGHPDRIAAEELASVGVFMGPGFAANQDEYRAEGKHREYEKTIKPGYPPKDVSANGIQNLIDSSLASSGSTQDVSLNDMQTVKPSKKEDLTATKKPQKAQDLTATAKPKKAQQDLTATKKPQKVSQEDATKPPKKPFSLFDLDDLLASDKRMKPEKREAIKDRTEEAMDKLLNKSVRLYVRI